MAVALETHCSPLKTDIQNAACLLALSCDFWRERDAGALPPAQYPAEHTTVAHQFLAMHHQQTTQSSGENAI